MAVARLPPAVPAHIRREPPARGRPGSGPAAAGPDRGALDAAPGAHGAPIGPSHRSIRHRRNPAAGGPPAGRASRPGPWSCALAATAAAGDHLAAAGALHAADGCGPGWLGTAPARPGA